MSWTIWKYRIEPGDKTGIDMPEGATLLDVQLVDGQPHLWAAVNPEAPKVRRHFRLIPTGIPFEDGPVFPRSYPWGQPSHLFGLVHVATFQITNEGNRPLVFHFFEALGVA
jgi:hypothetical protein